ncbi:MAG: hypothetical protein ACR2HF_07805 [Methylococcaceae bacterium]
MTEYHFATFTLEPVTPLHLGSGRGGMVAKSHSFVPAHLFGYALAAQCGRQAGGKPADFQVALEAVNEAVRFAPALILDETGQIENDWPDHPERYLTGQHHVALHLDTRSAADKALFETESLSTHRLYGQQAGKPLRLGGGLWFRADRFRDKTWQEWLNALRLGGELKSGLGHIRLIDWQPGRTDFHGAGRMDSQGLHLESGQRLWGAALDTTPDLTDAPLRPWLGRTYQFKQEAGGFGRHLAPVELVRLHGRYQGKTPRTFLPALRGDSSSRWGCWEST